MKNIILNVDKILLLDVIFFLIALYSTICSISIWEKIQKKVQLYVEIVRNIVLET